MTTKHNPRFELVGKAFGKNKKNAEERFRDLHPKVSEGRKLRLTYLYTDPPFRVYEVEWSTINRYGKLTMVR
jgi:hypothetical protein